MSFLIKATYCQDVCTRRFISLTLFLALPAETLSPEFVISHTSHRLRNNKLQLYGVCRDEASTGRGGRSETFLGRAARTGVAFHVLKAPAHSNGPCEAVRWPPPKGRTVCAGPCPLASISAALEDTAVAVLAGSTPAISETSKPRRHPLNGAC